MKIHLLNSPNIGKYRKLKFTIEKYWKNKNVKNYINLIMEIKKIKMEKIFLQIYYNLNYINVGDYTSYDNILDFTCLINALNNNKNVININKYFIFARGNSDINPSKMTKFFNTNLHYIIPENFSNLKIMTKNIFLDVIELKKLGIIPKFILIGAITYLFLSKNYIKNLKQYFEIYIYILKKINNINNVIFQFDEYILNNKLNNDFEKIFIYFYKIIKKINIKMVINANFGKILNSNLKKFLNNFLIILNIEDYNNDYNIFSLGIICSSINKTNILYYLNKIKKVNSLTLNNNLKLLPYDNRIENKFIRKYLSFFFQKINELKLFVKILKKNINFLDILYLSNFLIYFDKIKIKNLNLIKNKKKIKLNSSIFPYTTIGSFPQNLEIRILRKYFNFKLISEIEYLFIIKNYIYITIIKQIYLGIDILTNGEFERNDMVEYFSKYINNVYSTKNGWIQSYGTRYVKPPIIFNIKDSLNLTENWISFMNFITKKKIKIILSGPITIFKWSYCINEKYKFFFCLNISEIINKEIIRIQNFNCNIIQIDEPTLKECLPIDKNEWKKNLNNFLFCFNNCTKNLNNNIKIHTHICYSIFNDIVKIINKLNVDVISIESTREKMNNLNSFQKINLNIGAGLFDVHNPSILKINNLKKNIFKFTNIININKIWLNPDCGLKTRNWKEITNNLNKIKIIKKNILNKFN